MLATENRDQSLPREFDSMVAVLAGMFEEILEQPGIRPDDDFFELGGDSLAATALVLALEKIGVHLSVSALFDAPTVAGLASVANAADKRAEPSMVVLKAGASSQPVFIAPGLGGSVLEMVSFARKVATPRQIYGLQPRDRNGNEIPLATIEEAAQFYLPLIRSVQPRGPYILAGYSLGGLTALELGQTLIAAGEAVALLIMLDTLTPIEHFPLDRKIHFWARRALHHGRKMRRLPLRQLMPYLTGRANGLAKDLKQETIRFRNKNESGRPNAVQPSKAAGAVSATAVSKYRPRFYPGSIAFIQAEIIDEGVPYYPDLLWGWLAQEFTIHRVRGDHWSMLSQHADCIANAFSRCLDTVCFNPG